MNDNDDNNQINQIKFICHIHNITIHKFALRLTLCLDRQAITSHLGLCMPITTKPENKIKKTNNTIYTVDSQTL